MTILPTGRAWQTAWVEHRWLVYRLVRRPDGKLDKIPIRGRTNAAPEIAACLTFTEAVARTRPDHGIGYLPCPGSILIGLDFDDCITPWDDEPDPWAADLLSDHAAWIERSPSGRGLRVIAERRNAPAWREKRSRLLRQ
jgi:hypothetical protein